MESLGQVVVVALGHLNADGETRWRHGGKAVGGRRRRTWWWGRRRRRGRGCGWRKGAASVARHGDADSGPGATRASPAIAEVVPIVSVTGAAVESLIFVAFAHDDSILLEHSACLDYRAARATAHSDELLTDFDRTMIIVPEIVTTDGVPAGGVGLICALPPHFGVEGLPRNHRSATSIARGRDWDLRCDRRRRRRHGFAVAHRRRTHAECVARIRAEDTPVSGGLHEPRRHGRRR